MATPTLRAVRSRFPDAHFAALVRSYVRPLLDPIPWCDDLIVSPPADTSDPESPTRESTLRLARRLHRERLDLAVLLPNSFRAALLTCLARIPRRVGYARDNRSWLLTDRLDPPRDGRRFTPTPALDYYLKLAQHLGADTADTAMQLFTRPESERRADILWRDAAIPADHPVVLLNPGAKYGDAKMWPPDRFAQVGDQLIDQHHATILLSGAPNERPILDAVQAAARHPFIDLQSRGSDLSLIKSIIRRCDLAITNDTGPRHIAAAFAVPVISIFGPTDPQWTDIHFTRERIIRHPVDCGPCGKKICPLDHRCMTLITPERVAIEAADLLYQT